MRSGAKIAIVGGAFVLVAGGVGYGGYNLYSGITGGSSSAAKDPGKGGAGGGEVGTRSAKTGPPATDEVDTTSKAFFAAWSEANTNGAAQLTNNASVASQVLAAYFEEAHISGLKIVPGAAQGAKVPFTLTGKVASDGQQKPISYASSLTVVRGKSSGKALVDWQPAVVHPELKRGETLKTGTATAPPIQAVDRNGRELTKEKYPSLGPVLDQLRKKYGEKTNGKPGVELYIQSAEDTNAPARTLLTLSKGAPGELKTTIDAGVQAAAEKAVKQRGGSVVALNRTTGAVRAIANGAGSGNQAIGGVTAPGSTLKILTAAMLMEKGLVSPDRPTECPKEALYQGRTFHNLKNFELGTVPFSLSFAQSCNTAFIKLIDDVGDDAALPKFARDVFGVGLNWQTGIGTFDGRIPEGTGGEAAAQYIGQGQVQMNPLNVASIISTATTGTFHQPYLVAKGLDDREFATTGRSLSPAIAANMRALLSRTATDGTARKAMSSVSGPKGAKTGSAEMGGQAKSDSWFTGYAGDLAAAATVPAGGHGGDSAGPIVAEVLNAR
ncbi:penicillin-binding transpeptidase domain-containing protein [Streptomyces sp. NPDC021093]|uniref:penicillin-binding transpeptidase domain-containing protein n=1 Tax=Streptomyces sp. NPDC021093 TaxID=3365112 RepID=UPI0037A10618